MQDLARLGFVLLGLHFLVSPLAQIGSQLHVASAAREVEYLEPLLWSVGAWAVFGLAPGLVLLARNRSLAQSLFPQPSPEPLDSRSIFAALVAVLGVYLVVLGIGQLVIAVVSAALLSSHGPGVWVQSAGGAAAAVLLAGFGCFLVLRAAVVVRFVWRRPSL